ncbi:CCGSCS motif protein, partial [Vibrio lentus]
RVLSFHDHRLIETNEMTFSIKKIFKSKDTETTEETKLTTEETTQENNEPKKKIKHDTPSGCCGSCS